VHNCEMSKAHIIKHKDEFMKLFLLMLNNITVQNKPIVAVRSDSVIVEIAFLMHFTCRWKSRINQPSRASFYTASIFSFLEVCRTDVSSYTC
jgi:hypothetical protein